MDARVRSLFNELVDLPHKEREKVLAQQAMPPDVRAEVESLLGFDSGAEPPDMRWGPYRSIRVLGNGGMGTVYLAERTDGEIQQKVAIKSLRTDIERPAWRDRFLKERQLLANLNHPSIAHLIDAGHTQDGRPYLVMEYIDGIPIDEYCAKMELRQQLALFLLVCDGVSHAHHKLIIHRDLKPSNILVDKSGHPKLLDFGIAKLLDDTKNRTLTVDRLLTPNYASPEQLQGTGESTATDVYSLGAVLHKMLVGHSPNEHAESRRSVPADVEFILRKALRTEPEERYASVEAFANDILAFLDWQPVQARSGDTWYRTRKFLRRYWVPVGATVLMVAGLSAGLYAVNRERRIAEGRFEQVRQLSNKVLGLDSVIQGLPGATKARSEIVVMSKQYLEGMAAEGHPSNELALELSNAFRTLADVQGVPVVANLGQYAQAGESLGKADGLIEQVLAATPHDRKALLLSAQINQDRMILADADRRQKDVAMFARKSADRMETLLAMGKLSDSERPKAELVFSNIALAYKNLHQYDESVRYGRRTEALVRNGPGDRKAIASTLSIVADSLRYKGDLEGALKAIDEASAAIDSYEFPNEEARWTTLNNVLWRRGMILGADEQISLMRSDDAIAAFQDAFDTIEGTAKRDPNDASSRILFIQDGRELGKVLRHRYPERALAVFDHALARLGEIKNNVKARRGEAQLLAASSYPLRSLKRFGEAQQRIDRAFEILRQTKDYPTDTIRTTDETETVMRASADQLAETGRLERATGVYQELLAKLMASQPDPEHDLIHAAVLSRIYAALAHLYVRQNLLDQARANAAMRLTIWQNWDRKVPKNSFIQKELAAAMELSS
jgi:tRNA A-37 threonylcarbamoyl transferase component Bud32/tetratricopeptide (TPR) repeat protein